LAAAILKLTFFFHRGLNCLIDIEFSQRTRKRLLGLKNNCTGEQNATKRPDSHAEH
jgi:hypothetical protein